MWWSDMKCFVASSKPLLFYIQIYTSKISHFEKFPEGYSGGLESLSVHTCEHFP